MLKLEEGDEGKKKMYEILQSSGHGHCTAHLRGDRARGQGAGIHIDSGATPEPESMLMWYDAG